MKANLAKFFYLVIVAIFLFVAINIPINLSFCTDDTELTIVESGVGRFAFNAVSKENPGFLIKNFEFTKYDFLYFSSEDKLVYYWYKFNRAPFFDQFATVKATLPDGTLLIKDPFNSTGRADNPKNAGFSIATIRLSEALKDKKIKPSQYGKCKIELYTEDKRIVDTKYFYLDTTENLIQLAKNNNENSRIINRLEDNLHRRDKTYYILEKDGEFRYIYKGLSKDKIHAELGEPWKTKELGKNKMVWKYSVTNALYPVILESLPITGGNVAKVLKNGQEWPIGNTFVLVFEDGILTKIQ